eukprot:m.240544 g.240544  ORF g.240544 m.240544 type:complete len:303 (-) comp33764_c9_seq29:619-1527(-)
MDNRVVQHVLAGLSCFVTGEAGTGKTHLLKTLITKLSNKRYVSVTASTGAAASALDGMTLHSYISMRPSSGPLNILDILFYQSIKCVSRIRRTQVLVIDEISMISADMFDCVDKIMRVLRNSNLPFGGVQLILCGDFCQLPPVNGEFCFLSETWMFFKIPTFKLQSVQRAQDERLVNMLREIKCLPKGQALSLRTSETLTSLSREVKDVDGICHTCLCATNRECQTINDAALMKLDGPWFKCVIAQSLFLTLVLLFMSRCVAVVIYSVSITPFSFCKSVPLYLSPSFFFFLIHTNIYLHVYM